MQFKLVDITERPYFDTHLHSVPHGSSAMKNYNSGAVRALIDNCAEKKLASVCITDHPPLPPDITDPTPNRDCGIVLEKWEAVIKERAELRAYACSREVKVAFGGEFDYFPWQSTFYQKLDETLRPEFKVLGLHFIDAITTAPDANSQDCFGEKTVEPQHKPFCFDFSAAAFSAAAEARGGKNLMEHYWQLMAEALMAQRYDTVAHLDLINKYNQASRYFNEDAVYRALVEKVLNIMAKKKVALEINLGGTWFTRHLVPRDWIIQSAVKQGVLITIGSDAHSPAEMDPARWNFAYNLLQTAGLATIAVPLIT